MQCCRCLNKNAHPQDAENCGERCGFCLGYCSPVGVAVIITGLIISNLVYFALLISRNKTSAWRIVLSIIFILIPLFCSACVLWAYYIIIFTSPGYVPKDPWAHRPQYAGDGPGPVVTPSSFAEGHSDGQFHAAHRQQSLQARATDPSRNPSSGQLPCFPTEDSTAGGAFTENEARAAESVDVTDGPPAASRTTTVQVNTDERRSANGATSHSPFDTNVNGNPIAGTQSAAVPEASSPASRGHIEGAPMNTYTVKDLDRQNHLRYCHKCELYKPDLAHHCRVCDRCIYNFDHHCPYVNNCVGRNNYKVFLVFVLYGAVGSWLALICCVIGIFVIDRDPVTKKIGWVAIPAVELVLGLSLMCFYIQHRCMLCSGESTLESIIRNNMRAKQGWNYCKKPKLTEEEKAAREASKQAKVKAHRETLMGDEHPWYRRYLPYPVRTDDTAEDTIKHA